MRVAGSKSIESQRGAALVAVLLLSIIIGTLLLSIQQITVGALKRARSELQYKEITYALDSAALLAAYKLSSARRNEKILPLIVEINSYDVSVALPSSPPKVDLNLASERDLSEALGQVYDTDQAVEFAARIADWRDVDTLARVAGNDLSSQEARGQGRNGSFLSVSELRLVRGLEDAEIAELQEIFAVNGTVGNAGEEPRLLPRTRVSLEASISVDTVLGASATSVSRTYLFRKSADGRIQLVRVHDTVAPD